MISWLPDRRIFFPAPDEVEFQLDLFAKKAAAFLSFHAPTATVGFPYLEGDSPPSAPDALFRIHLAAARQNLAARSAIRCRSLFQSADRLPNNFRNARAPAWLGILLEFLGVGLFPFSVIGPPLFQFPGS